MQRPAAAPRRSLSRTLLAALSRRRDPQSVDIAMILAELGDRSFGWAILFFALVNMVPAPYGSTLITSLPLILLTAQMALGFEHLRLPGVVMRRRIPVRRLRRLIIRMRRVIRPIERVLRPRHEVLFAPRNERLIGVALCAVSVALFIPLPLSGGIPAFALFVSGLALVERDGLVMGIGLGIGALAIVVTLVVLGALVTGVQSVM